MIRNCWKYAVHKLERDGGWIIARFTHHSKSRTFPFFSYLGAMLVIIGIACVNVGSWMRSGRWLHAYHCHEIKGPYFSYEPRGPKIKRYVPPFDFEGHEVRHEDLK